ncbi:unnamed protein product, partial [Rotaria sp. Silwood2]
KRPTTSVPRNNKRR